MKNWNQFWQYSFLKGTWNYHGSKSVAFWNETQETSDDQMILRDLQYVFLTQLWSLLRPELLSSDIWINQEKRHIV